eukprot:jgi/Bigna1/126112/aug1.2_g820
MFPCCVSIPKSPVDYDDDDDDDDDDDGKASPILAALVLKCARSFQGAGSFKDEDEQIIKGLTIQIESMIVEDWRDYYINYAFLKRILARQDRKKYGEEKKRRWGLERRASGM